MLHCVLTRAGVDVSKLRKQLLIFRVFLVNFLLAELVCSVEIILVCGFKSSDGKCFG